MNWLAAFRRVLESLTRIDLAPERFPYLGVREGEVAEVSARLLRVGFVGEWGSRFTFPPTRQFGWDSLIEAGRAFGIQPFGVEAQRILRLERDT